MLLKNKTPSNITHYTVTYLVYLLPQIFIATYINKEYFGFNFPLFSLPHENDIEFLALYT